MNILLNSGFDNIKKRAFNCQQEIAAVIVYGKAGEVDQEVTVQINGNYKILKVTIDPLLLSPEKAHKVNELAAQAFDRALRALEAKMQKIFLKTPQENG